MRKDSQHDRDGTYHDCCHFKCLSDLLSLEWFDKNNDVYDED